MRTALAILVIVVAAAAGVYFWPDSVVAFAERVADLSPRSSQVSQPSAAPATGNHAQPQGAAAGSQPSSDAGKGGNGQNAKGGSGKKRGGRGGAQAITVATAVARTGDLPVTRDTIGWVQSIQTTSLTSQEQGTVMQILVREGSDVKEGDLLVKFDDRLQKASIEKDQATLQKDQATLTQARSDLERAQSLVKKGAGTQQSLDQAKVTAETSAATVAADQATLQADQVNLSNTELKAPFDGRLGAFSVTVGTLVKPGDAIVSVTKLHPIDVRFSLAEDALPKLRATMAKETVPVAVKPSGSTDKPVTGDLTFIDNSIDQASGTFLAKATMANGDLALWPGESVAVNVRLGRMIGLTLVPTVAVQPAEAGSIVFVVTPDKKIDVRHVEIAGADKDMTGLSKGLKAGEHVVVEGQLKLVAGMAVREKVTNDTEGSTGAVAKANEPAQTADASSAPQEVRP